MDSAGVVTGTVLSSATIGTHSYTVSALSVGYVTQTYLYPLVIKAAAVVPTIVVPTIVVPTVVVPTVVLPTVVVPTVVPDSATYKSIKVTINFKSGSSKLSATEKKKLLRLVAKYGPKVTGGIIVGYVQSDGKRKNDARLSTARAHAIARYLAGRGVKVPLLTQGKGVLNASAKSRMAMLTLRYKP
jgi:outer membrane protein OmpA-like peptidoglycan-associated protein